MRRTVDLSFPANRAALKRVALVTFACGVLGAVYVVVAPRWYRSIRTVVPAKQQRSGISGLLEYETLNRDCRVAEVPTRHSRLKRGLVVFGSLLLGLAGGIVRAMSRNLRPANQRFGDLEVVRAAALAVRHHGAAAERLFDRARGVCTDVLSAGPEVLVGDLSSVWLGRGRHQHPARLSP
jgi:hypothetical protein